MDVMSSKSARFPVGLNGRCADALSRFDVPKGTGELMIATNVARSTDAWSYQASIIK